MMLSMDQGPTGRGEFGDLAQPHEVLKKDIKEMHDYANSSSLFLGGTVFQPLRSTWSREVVFFACEVCS